MTPYDLPSNVRPWLVATVLVAFVAVASLVVRALVPASITNPVGTALLVAGVVLAAATGVILIMQGQSITREVAFAFFLVFLFLSLILR